MNSSYRPSRWQLWSLPQFALYLVLGVNAVAVAITVRVSIPMSFSSTEFWYFVILTVCALGHLEAARTIERRRELAPKKSPYTNLKSLWVFAALLLLPLPLVIALTAISYGYCWLRVYGPAIAFRKVYSASTFVVASAAAEAVLHAGGLGAAPRLPHNFSSLVIVVSAAAVWWLTNYALVVFAILLSSDEPTTARQALGHPCDQLVVAAALGLGVTVAALLVHDPWVLPAPMIAILAVHLDLLLPQYMRAARTDQKTGLASPVYWTDVVSAELRRAELSQTDVGVLFLDLDNFKDINENFGHLAGDETIQAVADIVQAEVRARDLVARWGGDEIAIVLPGIDQDQLVSIAERIRGRLAHSSITLTATSTGVPHALTGVTTSMGVASYPADGTTADQLLLAADGALRQAKAGGRNRVRTTNTVPIQESPCVWPGLVLPRLDSDQEFS
ncbi:MAG TPA: GGDEF domain-containing protein [Amycolatopsis sp.]|nr:GGDEF domain-containing protein [Amycolatopsis sp.]